ncbi:MAG: hypothetical protein D6752_06930 [Candidatus Nitrosothermus koennekii]|nr:MAG: hypothetical protein D6752_06930 [Candidatus Nitrosothermus koennekii]
MSSLPNDLCKQILALDPSIRYAGILDRSEKIIMQEHREDVQSLLPNDVREISLKHAAQRMRERTLLRPYIGKPLYFIGVYEKIVRATIPLSGKYYLLALSMNPDAEYDKIIREKILPFLEKNNLKE